MPSSAPPRSAIVARGGTKDRLLESALEEFAAHGYAGARVERIAAAAKANVASIYRYFGKKRELYDAVLEWVHEEGVRTNRQAPAELSDRLSYYVAVMTSTQWRQALRIYQWAELEGNATSVHPSRGQTPGEVLSLMRDQAAQVLPPDLDPAFVYLFETAIVAFPQMMPAWTEQIVGMPPNDPAFIVSLQHWLQTLARHLRASGHAQDPAGAV
jgi:TetR/AcrR family transcriptional regulator